MRVVVDGSMRLQLEEKRTLAGGVRLFMLPCRYRCARVCARPSAHRNRGGRAHVLLLGMLVSEQVQIKVWYSC